MTVRLGDGLGMGYHLLIAAEDGPCRLGAQVVRDLVHNDAVVGQNRLHRRRVARLNGQNHVAWLIHEGNMMYRVLVSEEKGYRK